MNFFYLEFFYFALSCMAGRWERELYEQEILCGRTDVASSAASRSAYAAHHGASVRARRTNNAAPEEPSAVQRLTALEASVRKLELELALKQRRVEQLRAEVRGSLEVEADGDAAAAASDAVREQIDEAQRENATLMDRVERSNELLESFDLRWVGVEEDGSSLVPLTAEDAPDVITVNVDRLVDWVRRLNYALGERGDTRVASDGRSARIARRDMGDSALPLTIYADGLFLERGPFQPWAHPAVLDFVRAVGNGQRPPHIAADRFFVVTDRREVLYADSGEGGGAAAAAAGSARVRTAAGSSARASHELPMAQSELLKRMPESVVRGGVVVDVRRVIAEHLAAAGGGGSSASADAARQRAERDVVRAKRLAALGAK